MKRFEDALGGQPRLVAAISLRSDGDAARPWVARDEVLASENREAFLGALDISSSDVVVADLVHGARVISVDREARGTRVADTDGLVTREPGTFLSVTVADCLPVFLFDPESGTSGILHAGWRGLRAGIIASGVGVFRKNVGDLRGARALVGPGIGPCHFEVKGDVWNEFSDFGNMRSIRDEKRFLDLKEIAKAMLISSGFLAEHVSVDSDCTLCLPERYFSYRRDEPEVTEAMMALVGIRSR